MSYPVYVKVDLNNNEEIRKIEELLKSNGFGFEMFDYPSQVFYKHEAECRVEFWEDENNELISDKKVRDEIIDKLADMLFLNEGAILDGEYIEEMTLELINEYMYRR